LELVADQFYRSRVDQARFRKERRIVEDEIRGYRDDPVDYVNERGWGAFFGAPIGHPICGTIGSLRAMEPAHVVAFLQRHFVNANAALAVVGGVSEAELRSALQRHLVADRPGRPSHGSGARRGRSGTLRVSGGPRGQAYV